MIESLFLFLESTVLPLGGWGVFFACLVEEIIAPIPSALVLASSGALFLPASESFFSTLLFTIIIPASLGITFGSLVVFGGAYWLGKPFILRFGTWFGLSWAEIERMSISFSRGWRDELTIFSLRAIPLVPSVVISASAGLLRIPLRSYVVATLLGTFVRATLLAFVGWGAGEAYIQNAEFIDSIENGVLIALIVACVLWAMYKIFQKRTRSVV